MQREIVCYGAPSSTCIFPDVLLGGHDMTAISIVYAHHNGTFVVAADGRRASGPLEQITILNNMDQKIFLASNPYMHIAYAISGLSMIGKRLFETIAEAKRQIDQLVDKRFLSGHQYSDEVSTGLARVLEMAIKNGRIPANITLPGLPREEKGRLFKLYICGYYDQLPFLRVDRFYLDGGHRVSVRQQDFELSQSKIAFTGSDKVAAMIYGNAPIDPRIAKYRPPESATVLGMASSFIQACSDTAALGIDPWCAFIGGHMHAAEITREECRWLIRPAA